MGTMHGNMGETITDGVNEMVKYTNDYGKECWKEATMDSEFSAGMFYEVPDMLDDDQQWALHTDIGSLTVLDRMTGFGYRDIETGYRDMDGKFWLASGGYDVRRSGAETLGAAIEWVKRNANTCCPDGE
jgi:hypothetical protein